MRHLEEWEKNGEKLRKQIGDDFHQRQDVPKQVISSKNSRTDMQSRCRWSRDMQRNRGGEKLPGQWVFILDKQANKEIWREEKYIVVKDGGRFFFVCFFVWKIFHQISRESFEFY